MSLSEFKKQNKLLRNAHTKEVIRTDSILVLKEISDLFRERSEEGMVIKSSDPC